MTYWVLNIFNITPGKILELSKCAGPTENQRQTFCLIPWTSSCIVFFFFLSCVYSEPSLFVGFPVSSPLECSSGHPHDCRSATRGLSAAACAEPCGHLCNPGLALSTLPCSSPKFKSPTFVPSGTCYFILLFFQPRIP